MALTTAPPNKGVEALGKEKRGKGSIGPGKKEKRGVGCFLHG